MENWNTGLLPDELKTKIESSRLEQITIGESGAFTFLVTKKKAPNRYLKIAPLKLEISMQKEVELLKWLKGKLPVPEVLLFICDTEYEYLLMSEVKGVYACDAAFGNDMPNMVRLLAEGLRMIHSVDINGCPFDQTLESKLKEAEDRVHNSLIAEEDFEDMHLGKKAADLFQDLLIKKPSCEDIVFTHGDYCLPNIMIHNGDIGGFIDWGRGGISDRYQDLALAARSLAYNFDEKWVSLLFKEYGIDNIDYGKIGYYKLLDEFF